MNRFDVTIIGGGVIGVSIAKGILELNAKLRVCILEKENEVGSHQSGRNSGVVHVGYNQKPGSMKARFVVEGSRRLREYCKENRIPLKQHGIYVVARDKDDILILHTLIKRGRENGVELIYLDQAEMRKREPSVHAVAGVFAPDGASFDSKEYTKKIAEEVTAKGSILLYSQKVISIEQEKSFVKVRTQHNIFETAFVVNAAGLHADRIAQLFGLGKQYRIVPFRGDYYYLKPSKASIISAHIYPTPNLAFPFLGVHFTKMFDGRVKIGPTSRLAFGRESYKRNSLNLTDMVEVLLFEGTWKLFFSKQFISLASREGSRGIFRNLFVQAAKRIVPGISGEDLGESTVGIRAQLVDRDGSLVDDLVVEKSPNSIHILNAISPALTCSLPFGRFVAQDVCEAMA